MHVKHDGSASWGRKAFKIVALFVGTFIVLPFIALVVYDMATANKSTDNSSKQKLVNTPNGATSTNNLQLQNECIANAQAVVNNDPLNQPVGGDPESQSLASHSKSFAMQPEIAKCQVKYPIN